VDTGFKDEGPREEQILQRGLQALAVLLAAAIEADSKRDSPGRDDSSVLEDQ
jgi:hypothetical protein